MFCSVACRGLARRSTDTKQCERCGTDFPVGGFGFPRDRRFCSKTCSNEARSRRIPCESCGKEIKPPRRFCSRECWYRDGLRKGDQKIEFSCVKCGTKFERWASQRRQAKTPYCSAKCYFEGREYKRGKDHPQWKGGGRWLDGSGYVRTQINGAVLFEHRLVMEKHLGRKLDKHETVHHINGDRADNRIENLQLRKGNHGKGVVMACLDCGSHNVGKVPIA
ncbi:MAG: HNH endonuclease [Patescibacteria group bacterium]|nr:HNH endonuclease [Patescibacteria group bacterium]